MRITDLRERTVPIASSIANAYIDFSKMTLSLVAVVTDVIRDGRPVVGYGFNSNGRYGQGSLIRERFRAARPRGGAGEPAGRERRQPRPAQGLGDDVPQREAGRPWRALRRHGHDRHGGVGRGGEDRGQAAVPPAGRAPRRRPPGRSARLRLRGRRLLLPRQGHSQAQGRDAELPRPRLHGGEDEDRRRAARRRPEAHRGGARHAARAAASWRWTRTAGSTCRPRSSTPRRSPPTSCSGTRRPATRSTTRCKRSSRSTTPGRWRRARTCSPCRMRAT